MRTQQEYIDLLRRNYDHLAKTFGIRSIVLFGSVARNEHHEGSDIDILVDMPPVFFKACAAADYLEDLLGCKVDLIRDHNNLNEFFRNQILKDGIEITPAA